MAELRMPKLGDLMEEGTILAWLRADGDDVAPGDDVVEIETDKATATHAAGAGGVLAIVAPAGTTVPVGSVIARIGDDRAGVGPRRRSAQASPVARRMAAGHGIDLDALEGTGPAGRIRREDVERAIAAATASASVAAPAAVAAPTATPASALTRMQRTIAARMSEAHVTVPDLSVQIEIVMDAVLAMRRDLRAAADGPAPSVNDLVVKACGLALRRHPRVNATFAEDGFVEHDEIDVGFAVAATDALVVPVVRGADRRTLGEIAAETRRLAEAARDGSIAPADLSGGTFTISNLGMFGSTAVFPIVNPPQAAILGVAAPRDVLALESGDVVVRRTATFTLTCDHRILYGADGARFLADLKQLLEAPMALAL